MQQALGEQRSKGLGAQKMPDHWGRTGGALQATRHEHTSLKLHC